MLVSVTNTLTFIRFRWAETSNFSCGLTDSLFVYALHNHLPMARAFSCNTLGQLVIDRVGKAHSQVD